MLRVRLRPIRQAAAVRVTSDEGYARWAPEYPPFAHNALMRAEQRVVVPLLATAAADARVLDAGTGSGRYLPLLAAAGARQVIGLDRSPAMLAQQVQPARLVRGDARHLAFRSNAFDLVTAFLMVGDLPDLAGWTKEVARVLVPGGGLIYSDFHPCWAGAGWRRTFTTAAGVFELPYRARGVDEHLSALHDSGFDVVTIREPRLLHDDVSDGRANDRPVVIVVYATRRGAVLTRRVP